MTNAYIYIRYSDPKQALGSSYERQLEKARTYCATENLNFSDEHVFFGDGVSAYKNEHIAEGGKLKELYDMIDDGTIPSGSYTPDRNKSAERRAPKVERYFPRVVEDAVFYEAQAAITDRRNNAATRQSKVFNVWAGIAKCTSCGGSMHCVPKGRHSERYLVCSNKIAGKCSLAKNVRNAESEQVFRELLVKVDSLSLVVENKAEAEKEMRELEGRIAEEQRQSSDLGAALARRYTQQLDDLAFKASLRLSELEQERENMKAKLTQEQIKQEDKAWFLDKLDLETYAGRNKANALLKRLGITVRITGGAEQVYVASRPRHKPDGPVNTSSHHTYQDFQDFLQMVHVDNKVVIVPLTPDQREKFKKQDPDAIDSDNLDAWLKAQWRA